jgi:hypothetical protein
VTSRLVALICLASCDGVFGLAEIKPFALIDATEIDAPLPDAAVFGPFSLPVRVNVPTPSETIASDPALTADEQQMIYTLNPAMIPIQIASRGSGPTDWEESVTPSFAQPSYSNPVFSPDGDLVLVADNDVGNLVTLERIGTAWQVTTRFDGVNSSFTDRPGTPTADLSRIMIYRDYYSHLDMHEYELTSSGWVDVSLITLGAIRFAQPEPMWTKLNPRLTPDGLMLVYVAGLSFQQRDLYLTTRPHVGMPFAPPVKIEVASDPELNEGDPWLSPDGRRVYFSRYGVTERTSEFGIYFSQRATE